MVLIRPFVLAELQLGPQKAHEPIELITKAPAVARDDHIFAQVVSRVATAQQDAMPVESAVQGGVAWQRAPSQIQQLRELRARSQIRALREAKIDLLSKELSLATSDATSSESSSSSVETLAAQPARTAKPARTVYVKRRISTGEPAEERLQQQQQRQCALLAPGAAAMREVQQATALMQQLSCRADSAAHQWQKTPRPALVTLR